MENKVTFIIHRYNPESNNEPYIQEYKIDFVAGQTILEALREIKATIDSSLSFRCSCGHGICGSCAMEINGRNILTCEAPIFDHLSDENVIIVKPLKNTEVVRDLVIDEQKFWEKYEDIVPWLVPTEKVPDKEFLVSPELIEDLYCAEHCILCGVCYYQCPAIINDPNFLGPHSLLKSFLRSNDPRDVYKQERLNRINSIWQCTTCYACESHCPKGLKPSYAIKQLRKDLVEENMIPETIENAFVNTFESNNPFGLDPSERAMWVKDLNLHNDLRDEKDYLYFACCSICFDPNLHPIGSCLINTLSRIGLSIGSLGTDEICCGSEINRMGEKILFESIMNLNLELFSQIEAKAIVTSSPHCFDAFKNSYNTLPMRVMHYTELVAQLLSQGELKFTKSIPRTITYHDPCYLGIQNDIYDEPRFVINQIPGVTFKEMEHNRETSICCGGGGGKLWIENKNRGLGSAEFRILEAKEIGAEVIATSCPFCHSMLNDALKSLHMESEITVKDIMEIVYEAL